MKAASLIQVASVTRMKLVLERGQRGPPGPLWWWAPRWEGRGRPRVGQRNVVTAQGISTLSLLFLVQASDFSLIDQIKRYMSRRTTC